MLCSMNFIHSGIKFVYSMVNTILVETYNSKNRKERVFKSLAINLSSTKTLFFQIINFKFIILFDILKISTKTSLIPLVPVSLSKMSSLQTHIF